MVLKVVVNNIVDIINFDQNTDRSNVTELWKIKKNCLICEFGELNRLPEGEKCKIGSISWSYKLFKILFRTTFFSIKTLLLNMKYLNQICQIFEFFESGKFWRLLEGEWCILEDLSWIPMLFKMTFLTTFISIIKLYNSIIKLLSI